MKMKMLFCSFAVVVFSLSYSAVAKDTVIIFNKFMVPSLSGGAPSPLPTFARSISPDGKYICGYGVRIPFSWSYETDTIRYNTNPAMWGKPYAISNTGRMVGLNNNQKPPYEGYEMGGYFDGTDWVLLKKLDPSIPEQSGVSFNDPECISADGTVIGGTSPWGTGTKFAPVLWEWKDNDFVPRGLEYEKRGYGARILAMSSDAKVIGGYAYPYSYTYEGIPAIWDADGKITYLTYNDQIELGRVRGISHNGKYAAVRIANKAAIYDIENKKLIVIGKKDEAVYANAICVTNDGIVLGYNYDGSQEPYIWREDFGMIPLRDYFTQLNIKMPEDPAIITLPASISEDGLKMALNGYTDAPVIGMTIFGFYVELNNHLPKKPNPAKNLIGHEESLGKIKLNWEAPTPVANATLAGYNIYRNNAKIATTSAAETTYTDDNLQNGRYTYTVTATYGNNSESIPTLPAKVNTALLNIPFLDEFNGDLSTMYWNTAKPNSFRASVGGFGRLLFENIQGTKYDEAVISPHLNVSGVGNLDLYLSYNIAIPDNDGGNRDTVNVEIFDGNQWHLISSYISGTATTGGLVYKEHSISSYRDAGQIRVRFRNFGNNNNITWPRTWTIDNVAVYTTADKFPADPPRNVSAHYTEDKKEVHINWSDPNDVAELSYLYLEYDSTFAIGNAGKTFIVANKFDAKDLTKFDGFKLTGLQAILTRRQDSNITITAPAVYKWVVFQGDEKVLSKDVGTYTPNAWNTIVLDEPITIDANKSLIFGVEVVTHEVRDYPIGCVNNGFELGGTNPKIKIDAGRSDIHSEDDGKTWEKLFDESSVNIKYLSYALKALIKRDVNAQPRERIYGYAVYRNNQNLMDLVLNSNDGLLTMSNNFTDNKPLELTDETICYSVLTYYANDQTSDRISFCFNNNGSISEEIEDDIIIYPNSTNGIINILGDFRTLLLYDMNGIILQNTTSESVDMTSYPSGVYFLKVYKLSGSPVVKKIIKE